MGRRKTYRGLAALVALCSALIVVPPATGRAARDGDRSLRVEATIQALTEKQLELLDIPDRFLPFLRDDAKVRTGRELFGRAAPDMNGNSMPEVLETDLRYSYEVGGEQDLPSVSSDVNTRVTVRAGATGKKLWAKRYDRDAWPIPMKVGEKGRQGVLVISGLWNFFGTTAESTLGLDAFDGRNGKHLWSREYRSISYYELLTSVSEDAPLVLAGFDALEGRADDLLLGLATRAGALLTSTTATRVVVIDGADGTEHPHPLVDVGVGWVPVPLPTGDLDDDHLDDYATTNRYGIDPGGQQQQPTIGGTVYTRKGADGTPIWTTSGIDMAMWAFPNKLPDVMGDSTPEVGVSTYVAKKAAGLVPIDLPLLSGFDYRERVYLFEGRAGSRVWHKPYEWVTSPGDIDGNGKHDLLLGKYRVSFKRNRSTLYQLAVSGYGRRLWRIRSVWNYQTAPCPENACLAGYWFALDPFLDVQPDAVDDVLLSQGVEQNAVFEDVESRVFNGRTGRMNYRYNGDLYSTDVAVDGRGTDVAAYKLKGNVIDLSVRDGSNKKVLWEGKLGGPDRIPQLNTWLFPDGFMLPGDRCGDVVITGYVGRGSFYAVFDGGDGHILWSRWTGAKGDRPTFTERRDANRRC